MRTTIGIGALVCALVASACSGNTPTAPAPSPVPQPPPTAVYSLSGTVTATNGSQPLPGLSASLSGPASASATTDSAGHYASTLTMGGTYQLALTGGAIVPRSLTVNVFGPKALDVSAIVMGGGFDLTFYREYIRNTKDAPGGMEPLRRWTTNPRVFLEPTSLVDANTVDMVERVIRDAVPVWSAGQLSVASVMRAAAPNGVDVLRVVWSAENSGSCGSSLVGGSPITLYPKTPRCACGGYGIGPATVRHETGHAMGYWHTDAQADVMYYMAEAAGCDHQWSARERFHAAIAYARPVGNMDPDTDPASAVNLAPMRIY